ncbi:RNA polymerase sigma factor [Exiguobacterium flavidum]|uniref:RNA polymerase sigma factor n=1 Tax=Exiguobacterium flavidum TaxID=2184695 RepID=UPI001300ADC3|nr:RNA polymerase sigma factor [Exiguobacterium flavidum]
MRQTQEETFQLLVEPQIVKARQTAYLLLRDHALAEDAVQDALLETFRSLHKFDPQRAQFKTWFFKIVIHMTLKVRRRRRLLFPFTGMERDEGPSVMRRYELKEETEHLLRAVHSLGSKYEPILLLHYYHDFSVKEIAHIMSVKEGTVKSRLHHARKKLRHLLTESEARENG